MVPKVTKGGSSFKGAFRYYLHDKGADTSERIEWVHTENMRTVDPAKAWKAMAYTAQAQERLKEASGQSRAGRKLERPVFAFSLAWHPEQSPDRAHMLATARSAIDMLGLGEHEAVYVSHRDEPQKHVHVIVNRVHPITGMAGDIRNSKRKFSDFARAYEEAHGKLYCPQRETNRRKREKGEPSRYCDPVIVEAWNTSMSGRDFVAALAAKKYRLAHGRKRLVIIDPHGKAHNPMRNLKGVRPLEFLARLKDLDFDRLPDASAAFAKTQTIKPERDTRWKTLRQLAKAHKETRERHKQDYEKAHAQHVLQVQSARNTLAAFYGLRQKKRDIIQLKEKIDHASWWQRLIGTTRRERKMFSEQVADYKHFVSCYREKVARIEKDGLDSLAKLHQAQQKEQMGIKLQLDIRRAFGNSGPTMPEQTKKERSNRPSRAFNRDRQRGR